MGRYSKQRNVKNFWKNPLVNLCYTLAVLAFVAGLFGVCAVLGGADCLLFAILSLVAGVLFIALGRFITSRKKKKSESQND